MAIISFGSVCSGIEAASVAWHPLGWRAKWLAEIEPFPSAVLAHHYPDVPNLGDMTTLPELVRRGSIPAPDVLVGGTPCQAFSVAGLRGGLNDERGALTLAYVELANEIDRARAAAQSEPCIIVWENVPGVLSSKDNAFGCFLAGLAGEDDPLLPSGPRWSDAGCVYGPKRAVAWRILDAQYFGLAQRRRRVFVIASARAGFDPAAVLFEFDGVRRDSAPSREAPQDVAGTIEASIGRSRGAGSSVAALTAHGVGTCGADDNQAQAGHLVPVAFGQNNTSGPVSVSHALNAHAGPCGRLDFESETFLVQPIAFHPTQDPISSTDGSTHAMGCGSGGGQASVAVAHVNVAPTLRAGGNQTGGDRPPGTDVDTADSLLTTTAMQVRRLTPVECERLMGYPDGYTAIPWRKKPASECPDGPRHKALGNSMAVPCMRWIGQRIAQQLELSAALVRANCSDMAAWSTLDRQQKRGAA